MTTAAKDTNRQRWLLVGVLVGLLAVRIGFQLIIDGDWIRLESGPVLCPFRAITGLPCPGCGMTRATVACTMGDWRRALDYNALAIPFWLVILIHGITAWLPETLRNGWRRLIHQPQLSYAALALVVVVWLRTLSQQAGLTF